MMKVQSRFFAIRELVNLVENGMKLVGTPMERFDDIMESVIKTLKRHKEPSEYAETELIHIGHSVRHINQNSLNGAIIFLTRPTGVLHPTHEILWDIENTLYFPKEIIEKINNL